MDVEEEEPGPSVPPTTHGLFAAPARPLGKFMTPQVSRQADFGVPKNKSRSHVMYSGGGFTPGGIYGAASTGTPGPSNIGSASGPRRVRLVEPWKIGDITVPVDDDHEGGDEVERGQENIAPLSTPKRGTSMSPSKRERLTEEERKVRMLPS